MDDARLKSLYRRMTASQDARSDVAAEDFAEVLSCSGYPDVEGTPLDRIAASASHADLLRVALAVAPDAGALSREVIAARAPRRMSHARGWLSLAAGVGAAAVLIAGLRSGPQPVGISADSTDAPEVILSVSFDSPEPESIELDEPAPIFEGGFDS